MTTREQRKLIAEDTLARINQILQETPHALSESFFFNQITFPPLQINNHSDKTSLAVISNPGYGPTPVVIEQEDDLVLARKIIHGDASAKVAVLNVASDEEPAGGWLRFLTRTQEECLCYSTTLYPTLRAEWYPWPNLGPGSCAGIYSPSVVVFKDDLAHDCADLPTNERIIVSIITVAGPRNPAVITDPTTGQEIFARESDILDFRDKVRLVLRCAARSGQDHVILGALGCGVYASPPLFIAQEMKKAVLEDEFKGWFKKIFFTIRRTTIYEIFKEVFKGCEVNN
ncbi:hypothetical protein Clacol_005626 [Clathrus columnatus]|uniref:Microbial-type PARG catalytic domain-containing protein n=1 Tax=Clathrus columnatus TaxID=1419009 RepID=A0AAV5AE41_9AGAM|nr:hypothetical protein Clacol_005626 [Clathrus columnatus]